MLLSFNFSSSFAIDIDLTNPDGLALTQINTDAATSLTPVGNWNNVPGDELGTIDCVPVLTTTTFCTISSDETPAAVLNVEPENVFWSDSNQSSDFGNPLFTTNYCGVGSNSIIFAAGSGADAHMQFIPVSGLKRFGVRFTDCAAQPFNVGDLNNDGTDEIYFGKDNLGYIDKGNEPGSSVSRWCGSGSGFTKFCWGGSEITRPSGLNHEGVALGDINGDGFGDMGLSAPDGIIIYYGNNSLKDLDLDSLTENDGFFIPFPAGVGPLTGLDGNADFNNDGVKDFAMAFGFAARGDDIDAGLVYIVKGREQNFPHPMNLELELSNGVEKLYGTGASVKFGININTMGDFNNDGFGDLVIGSTAGIQRILLGQKRAWSDMTEEELTSRSININGANGSTPDFRTPFDFNGDGLGDLVINFGDNIIWVIFGRDEIFFKDSFESE